MTILFNYNQGLAIIISHTFLIVIMLNSRKYCDIILEQFEQLQPNEILTQIKHCN